MAEEIAFENEGFPTLKGSWPWPLIRSNCIPPCITHRPLPTYMPNFIEIKLFVDGRTSETHFIRSAPKSQPNKMQLETADFVPGATTWQTVWNIHIISHYAHSHDVINKTGSTGVTLPPEQEWAMATGNMYWKFDEIWTCVHWQKNRHAITIHPYNIIKCDSNMSELLILSTCKVKLPFTSMQGS